MVDDKIDERSTAYPFADHAIHLRGLAKVSLNALPRFSSTFEYDTKRCVE
jgi:hypothetical protein